LVASGLPKRRSGIDHPIALIWDSRALIQTKRMGSLVIGGGGFDTELQAFRLATESDLRESTSHKIGASRSILDQVVVNHKDYKRMHNISINMYRIDYVHVINTC
jgi:hypothetical protein